MSVTIDKIKELEEKEVLKKELELQKSKLEEALVAKTKSVAVKKESLYNDVFNSILTFKSQSAQAKEIKDLYNWEKDSISDISKNIESVYNQYIKSSEFVDLVKLIIDKYNIEDAKVVAPLSLNGFDVSSDGDKVSIYSKDEFEVDLSFNSLKDVLTQKFADLALSIDNL